MSPHKELLIFEIPQLSLYGTMHLSKDTGRSPHYLERFVNPVGYDVYCSPLIKFLICVGRLPDPSFDQLEIESDPLLIQQRKVTPGRAAARA